MKLGLFNLMTLRDNPAGARGVIADTERMVLLAEDIGFDTAWFAEHHFTNYSLSVSPLMTAAYMAARTSRIRMGAAVVVLPLYHPLRVAQEIALLDQLSDGRAMLGLGTGYQPYEFDRFGAPLARKAEQFLEAWDIVEQALTEGRAAAHGAYFQIPETVFTLRPRQRPLPPVYTTSVDPRLLRRLAGHTQGVFLSAGWMGSAKLMALVDNARSAWQAAGLTGAAPIALQQYIHVTDSHAAALDAAERGRFVGRMVTALRGNEVSLDGSFLAAPPIPGEPPLEAFRDNLLIGDPHHVAERMAAELRYANPVHYNCFFQFGDMPIEQSARALERFGAEVIPLLEKALAPLEAIGAPGARLAAE